MTQVLLLILTLSCSVLRGQSDCAIDFLEKYEAGKYQAAIALSENCPELDRDQELRFFKTRSFMYLGDYENAIPNYRALLAIDPTKVDYINGLGAAFYLKDENDSALVYYTRALEIEPSNVKALMNRSILYVDNSELEKADKDIAKLRSVNGGDSDYWVNIGDAYYLNEHDSNALTCYNNALKLNQNNYNAYRSLAELHTFNEEYGLALEYVNKAIAINKNDPFSYAVKGDIYYFQDDTHHQEALKEYLHSFKLQEEGEIAYYIGLCYEELGDDKNAKSYYQKAVDLDLIDSYCYANLANLLADEAPFEAIDLLDKSIEIAPRYHYSHGLRADILFHLGLYKEAIISYTNAIQLDSVGHFYYVDRAWAYREIGNTAAAIEDCNTSLRYNKYEKEAYHERAKNYFQQGDYERAKTDLDHYINFNPTFAPIYSLRAACFYKLGDSKKACADMETAASLGDDEAKSYLKKYCK